MSKYKEHMGWSLGLEICWWMEIKSMKLTMWRVVVVLNMHMKFHPYVTQIVSLGYLCWAYILYLGTQRTEQIIGNTLQITLQPDWQIDSGILNRPIMAWLNSSQCGNSKIQADSIAECRLSIKMQTKPKTAKHFHFCVHLLLFSV